MKKVWLGALVFALGVALAAPAMAIDWSATGWIGTIGVVHKNVTPAIWSWGLTEANGFNDTGSYLRMRSRLKLTARASENLYGVMYFEMNALRYGSTGAAAPNSTGAFWGPQTSGRTRPDDVEVKELYLDFRVPAITVPIWLRIGRQAFAIRPNVFLLQEGAGISGRMKIDPVTVYVGWGKIYQGNDYLADDWDIWMWDISAALKPAKVGIFGAYQDFRQTAPVTPTNPYGVWASSEGSPGADMGDLHLWWIGGYVDGKIGPIKGSLDFVYNGGEFDWDSPGATDWDYGGWLVRLVGSYVWNNWTFGLGFKYASGEDINDFLRDGDVKGYVGPYSEMEDVPRSDLLVMEGAWNQFMKVGQSVGMTGFTSGGYWFVRPFVDWQALDWLKLRFQFAYIGDTVDDGDLLTCQLDPTTGNVKDNDDIGWEIDLGAVINVYKNLRLNLGFGYLIAGDALDETWQFTDSSGRAVNDNESVDDPWMTFAEIVYTF